MVVQHNLTAMNANRYFGINNSKLSKSLEKLSSGYAINRAGDNAAGLAVSEKMRSQIGGLTQAVKNAQDGISMVQTYEGALTESDSILQRMKVLATQSANGSYDDPIDRNAIEQEFKQLNDELNQIADTDYNGVVVLNGGTMADGVKADGNGLIDYATATRPAQQLGSTGGFVKGIGTADYTGTEDATITFTAEVDTDGNVTWKKSDNATGNLTVNAKNGGFKYNGASVNIDTSKVVAGDTVTIEFKPSKAASGQTAEVSGYNFDQGSVAATITHSTIAIGLTDAQIVSQDLANAVNALNGLTIEETYVTTATAPTAIKVNGVAIPADTSKPTIASLKDGSSLYVDKDKKIWYKDAKGNETEIATITAGSAGANPTTAGTTTTTVLVSQAKYTPASANSIKLVEPEASVSQANSFTKSEAKMTYAKDITLQVGARTKDAVNFTFQYSSTAMGDLKADLNCTASGLGTDKLTLSTQEDANAAIDKIDQAINKVSMVRGTFGAIQNRLEHKIDNLNVTTENLTSAESRIRDTNMAEEMMNFTKQQILSQASQSMLAQANQLPQGVLSLLQ